MSSFTSIPILDMALADNPATKPAFLADLRHGLMEVGFLYTKNVGIPDELFQRVIAQGKAFFDIPTEEKLKIEMKKAPSFLGYSRLAAEVTAGAADQREQIDLSTEHATLRAPNQWPDPAVLPAFRPAFAEYLRRMADVAARFTSLVAEAIGLPVDAFDSYFDPPGEQQHKLKVVKYPDVGELAPSSFSDPDPSRRSHGGGGGTENSDSSSSSNNNIRFSQGCGPHKDSMLTSYLLQASAHTGCLQAQNARGDWVDCAPVDGTLLVAVGQALEALTGGVCASTTHRVLSPVARLGPRYSIPFFQGVRLAARFDELDAGAGALVGRVPAAVGEMRAGIVDGGREKKKKKKDDVEFTFKTGGRAETLGEATLRNRVRSHPDVAERWFPNILADVRREQAERAKRRDGEMARREEPAVPPLGVGGEPSAVAVVEAH